MALFKKNIDLVSKYGYADGSPYRNNPSNLIRSNQITMEKTSIPLMGIGMDRQGREVERKLLKPYSGQHVFEKSVHVKEIPMAILLKSKGGILYRYQDGGNTLYVENPNNRRLIAYQDSLSKYNASQAESKAIQARLQQYTKKTGFTPVKEVVTPDRNALAVTTNKNDPTKLVFYTNRPSQPKFDEAYHVYQKPKQEVVLGKKPMPLPPVVEPKLPYKPSKPSITYKKDTRTGYMIPQRAEGHYFKDISNVYENGGKLLQVNGNNGQVQTSLVGGERIFSRENTKAIIDCCKKADHDKGTLALGKMIFGFLKKQDTRKPEYVSE